MKSSERAKKHGQYAAQYDDLVEKFEAYNADLLFGLCFDFISSGDRLLALGIGTGLCAAPFQKFGLKISGADISREMMAECEKKGIADDLRTLDLGQDDFPYEYGYFNHVIANGVFHFIEDLDRAFRESWRVLNTGGTFGFSTMDPGDIENDYEKVIQEDDGIDVYLHSNGYITKLLDKHGFVLKKKARILLYKDMEKTEDMTGFIYVAQKPLRT
jgi:malonyl-CoA O-methyltransferase